MLEKYPLLDNNLTTNLHDRHASKLDMVEFSLGIPIFRHVANRVMSRKLCN